MGPETTIVGSVLSIRRYPVKSMQGEEINEVEVTERGVLGDRAYALVDGETGHIASAKYPRKWSQLLECYARFVEPPQLGKPLPPVWITLPDGEVVCSTQSNIDQVLSEQLGRDVILLTGDPCPRCVIITLAQGDLPHDTGILRTIAQHNQVESFTLAPGKILPAIAGVYTTIAREGRISQGNFISLQLESTV